MLAIQWINELSLIRYFAKHATLMKSISTYATHPNAHCRKDTQIFTAKNFHLECVYYTIHARINIYTSTFHGYIAFSRYFYLPLPNTLSNIE